MSTGLALTLDGIRSLIRDLRAAGQVPAAILVSEFEKKDLKEELMSYAGATMADAEELRDRSIAIVEGVVIASHKHVPRGKAWIVPRAQLAGKGSKIKLDNQLIGESVEIH